MRLTGVEEKKQESEEKIGAETSNKRRTLKELGCSRRKDENASEQ